jgi:DNA processing protein
VAPVDGALRWLAFSRVPGIGRARLRILMEHLRNPHEAWEATAAQLACLPEWDERTAAQTVAGRAEGAREAAVEAAAAERAGLRLLTLLDADYPDLLRQIPDAPPLLYIGGTAPLYRPSVAIVGSRRPSVYGLSVAERLGYDLAAAGLTVVSGMAAGIDSAAHRGALAGGLSVAVLGSGADVAYPAQSRRLHGELVRKGAILSEYPPGTLPRAHHFPERNRIISGLCLGIIVVEAGERSGTLITVGCALEQGRDVFAVPGPVTSPLSAGPHRLIREGATLISGAADLLQELAARWPQVPIGVPDRLPSDAGDRQSAGPEARLLAAIAAAAQGAEQLAQSTGLLPAEIQAALSVLEMKGLIRQLPGGLYCLRFG